MRQRSRWCQELRKEGSGPSVSERGQARLPRHHTPAARGFSSAVFLDSDLILSFTVAEEKRKVAIKVLGDTYAERN